MIDLNNHQGNRISGEFLFSVDEWISFQQQLVVADTVMEVLADHYKLKLLKELRGYWPARRLLKKIGFMYYEIRLILNPDYVQNRKIYYELNEYKYLKIFGLYVRNIGFTKTKKYLSEQIISKDLLLNDIEDIIGRW